VAAADSGGRAETLPRTAPQGWYTFQVDPEAAVPPGDEGSSLALHAAPNPFRGQTVVSYTLPESGRVRLAVYDVAGREVAVLVDEVQRAGRHETAWNGRASRGASAASGIYLVRLSQGDDASARMIVLLQ